MYRNMRRKWKGDRRKMGLWHAEDEDKKKDSEEGDKERRREEEGG